RPVPMATSGLLRPLGTRLGVLPPAAPSPASFRFPQPAASLTTSRLVSTATSGLLTPLGTRLVALPPAELLASFRKPQLEAPLLTSIRALPPAVPSPTSCPFPLHSASLSASRPVLTATSGSMSRVGTTLVALPPAEP